MTKNYSKYTATDFLTDDYFVDSMLTPDSENKAYWNALIVSGDVDVDEFISAYRTLEGLHQIKPDVANETIDRLWDRIDKTNSRKNIKSYQLRIIRYGAIACVFAGIIGISTFRYFNKPNENLSQGIDNYVKENIIYSKQPADQIQIVSGNQAIALNESNPKLVYDKNGQLRVNKKAIGFSHVNKELSSYNQLRVPYGKRAFVTLSDGTSLWVNTGTTVTYPAVFEKHKREIFVEGEVFAEVAHDKNRPFIFKTKKINVQVLGTVLNVTAYNEDTQTSVVLVSGSVKVKSLNGKPTLMKPDQLYSYSEQKTTLTNVEVENYTSWHDGNYKFSSEPIENILLRLARYYNVTMKLPTYPSGISCSGRLELKDNLDQVLNGLTEFAKMSYSVKDNEYVVKFN